MFVIYPRSVISVFYLLVIYPSILFVHIKYLVYDASKSYSPPPPPPHTHTAPTSTPLCFLKNMRYGTKLTISFGIEHFGKLDKQNFLVPGNQKLLHKSKIGITLDLILGPYIQIIPLSSYFHKKCQKDILFAYT